MEAYEKGLSCEGGQTEVFSLYPWSLTIGNESGISNGFQKVQGNE
jgi:hypothetical protein